MASMKVRRASGLLVKATYLRHVRTLTGVSSQDVDLYRLGDGTEIQCMSPTSDGRAIPIEVDMTAGNYARYRPGQ